MNEVIAMAGVSAAEREIVERVRVHILPMDEIEFTNTNGDPITVGGPDLVPGYADTIRADIEARGSTYVPQLVAHDGPAVGMVADCILLDDGIHLDVDLWPEGVEARRGRDFVSAWWVFTEPGADGRPTVATIVENSFTPTPQFALAQNPVSELETMLGDNESLHLVAATISAAAYLTPPGSDMTPEEIAAALLASEDFVGAIQTMIADAMAAAAPEEVEEAEEAAAMEDGEPEEEEAAADSVAASTLRCLDAIATRLEKVEKATEVAASLRGNITRPTGPTNIKTGAARIAERLERGVSLTAAVRENQDLNTQGA